MTSPAPIAPAAAPARRRRHGRRLAAVLALTAAYLGGMAAEALAQNCKPRRPRPGIHITHLGLCEYNPETFSFAGEPFEQTMCLLRASDRTRNIGPRLDSIPHGLASRVGRDVGLPERAALAVHLTEINLVWDFAPFLWLPLSRARDNDPEAPQARYFVIHDTSAPFLGWSPFPADIDENARINSLARYDCKDDWALAHVFINRPGRILLSRELSEPWRATKFERASRFGTDLRGLFLHVELVQPRGVATHIRGRNDARAPNPGFSAMQYERLALVYVIASVRSGRWLIPAFHAALDSGLRGGHDDPQNFEIAAFAGAIDRLVARLNGGEAPELPPVPELETAPAVASVETPATVAAETPAASDGPVVQTAAVAIEVAPVATPPVEAPPAVASISPPAAPAPEAASAAPTPTAAAPTSDTPITQAPTVAVVSPAPEMPAAEERPITVAAVTAETPIPASLTAPAELVPIPVPRPNPPAATTSASDDHAQQKKNWHKLNWRQKNAWWKQHNARASNRGHQSSWKKAPRQSSWKAQKRWGRYAGR